MAASSTTTLKNGRELKRLAAKPDVKNAVQDMGPGHRYKKGQHWSFWMEDDPRFDDGILMIARYRCIEGGDDESWWEKIE
jgi:hypothetical protein